MYSAKNILFVVLDTFGNFLRIMYSQVPGVFWYFFQGLLSPKTRHQAYLLFTALPSCTHYLSFVRVWRLFGARFDFPQNLSFFPPARWNLRGKCTLIVRSPRIYFSCLQDTLKTNDGPENYPEYHKQSCFIYHTWASYIAYKSHFYRHKYTHVFVRLSGFLRMYMRRAK